MIVIAQLAEKIVWVLIPAAVTFVAVASLRRLMGRGDR